MQYQNSELYDTYQRYNLSSEYPDDISRLYVYSPLTIDSDSYSDLFTKTDDTLPAGAYQFYDELPEVIAAYINDPTDEKAQALVVFTLMNITSRLYGNASYTDIINQLHYTGTYSNTTTLPISFTANNTNYSSIKFDYTTTTNYGAQNFYDGIELPNSFDLKIYYDDEYIGNLMFNLQAEELSEIYKYYIKTGYDKINILEDIQGDTETNYPGYMLLKQLYSKDIVLGLIRLINS